MPFYLAVMVIASKRQELSPKPFRHEPPNLRPTLEPPNFGKHKTKDKIMGREIRRVPANWEHPRYTEENAPSNPFRIIVGEYMPMFDRSYSEAIVEWIKNHHLWEEGKHPDQISGSGKEHRYYASWGGSPPDVDYYRPDWKPDDATWYQVYQTVSEGTPVSPPFATQDELIEYLVANGDFWDEKRGHGGWKREVADKFVKDVGWAPSMVSSPKHGIQSGVEALGND